MAESNTITPQARRRRTPEEMIADLQQKIEGIKSRARERELKGSAAMRATFKAEKALRLAVAELQAHAGESELLAAAEQAHGLLASALEGAGLSATTASPEGASARSERAPRRSTEETELLTHAIQSFVRSNEGCAMSGIVAELDRSANQIRPLINEMLADGVLRKTGERRGTRYFVGEQA